jgi:hypothetical protein
LALLSSLGLLPLGCASGDAVDGLQLHAADASVGPAPDGGQITHPPDGGSSSEDGGTRAVPVRDGGSSQLAACGQSAPVPNGELGVVNVRRSSSAAQDVFTGIERCDNGVLHRPAPVTCSVSLPRPLPPSSEDAGSETSISQVDYLYPVYPHQAWDAGLSQECQSDADCTERPYGFCARSYATNAPEAPPARCHYGCVQDADCDSGSLCQCDDPVGHCVPADCRSDADCAGDALCAGWVREAGCSSERLYACQSPGDQCNGDEDCDDGRCTLVDGTRQCAPFGPVCGRPFLVEGVARLAELRSGSDWAGGASRVEALTPAERDLAARFWARSALMEHASIAAFARFTLQLMHLGAPRDLIERSQQAMLDETAHAKACFALASRYLGSAVQPGPLAMDAALDEHELEAIAVLTFHEGCVGETVAALEAREALDGAREPDVRAALERIAADEQSHAELAWRFVRWAMGQSATVRVSIERQAARLEAELGAPSRLARDVGDLEVTAHGVLSERRRAHLRRAALAEVVLPCASELLASPPSRTQSVLV